MDFDSFNSFHYIDKEDIFLEVELERHNSSAFFSFHFNKIFDNSIKKTSLDLSDSDENLMLVDKLNISEIKPISINNECKLL